MAQDRRAPGGRVRGGAGRAPLGPRRLSRRPRVGLLTYGLDRPLSGVTRVALELGRALLARDDCEVVFLTPYRRGPFVGEPGVRRVFLPGCRLLPGLMALGGPLIGLAARSMALDVVHDPIGVAPFTLPRWAGRYRRIVTIHDAIAFEYPEGYPLLNNLLHRRYVPATLPNVDVIATGSDEAQRALGRHLGLAAERVRVIPNGVSPRFTPASPEACRAVVERYGLRQPFVLYVGAFKAHKNVVGLVDAFQRARRQLPNHQLTLVGPSQWSYPALAERLRGLDDAVRVLGYVADPDLPALYSAAAAFALPSFHDGFGLPVLEAMACGTPVVCSSGGALAEVAGGAAELLDPHEPDAIADALIRVCRDPELAASLSARGPRRAAHFNWQRTADAYARLYAELAAG